MVPATESGLCAAEHIFQSLPTHRDQKVLPGPCFDLRVAQVDYLGSAVGLGGSRLDRVTRTFNRAWCVSWSLLAALVAAGCSSTSIGHQVSSDGDSGGTKEVDARDDFTSSALRVPCAARLTGIHRFYVYAAAARYNYESWLAREGTCTKPGGATWEGGLPPIAIPAPS